MVLMIHWILALAVGGSAGALAAGLLCARRIAAKDKALQVVSQAEELDHATVVHKHRELKLLERHHEEETKLWLRSVRLLEEAGAAARLHERHYDAVIECKDRELHELRQTVVGVQEMSERLGELEDFVLIARGYTVARCGTDPSSSGDLILKLADKLIPRAAITSIEEVCPSDEEARSSEEAHTARA